MSLRFPLLVILAALAFGGAMRANPPGVVRHWAPGIINPAGGTTEMDIVFLRSRAEMGNDWYLPLRVPGNSPGAGNTILGVAFCPPNDSRDFAGIVHDSEKSRGALASSPAFDLDRPYRLALAWGDGAFRIWFDGREIARSRFTGELPLLPEFFTAGQAGVFRIDALRFSDRPRNDAELARAPDLVRDAHTTYLALAGQADASGRPTLWQREQFSSALFPDRRAARLVVAAGSSLPLSLRAVNYTDHAARFRLRIEIRDRAGRQAATKDYDLSVAPRADYQPASIALPPLAATGYHEATLTVTSPAGRQSAYELSFVVQPDDTAPEGRLADYLGHHHLINLKPDFYTQLGIRWDRTWAHNRIFLWGNVEPAPGHFLWDETDHALATAEAAGIRTLGLLGNPPAWASTYSEQERTRLLPVIEKFNYPGSNDWSRRPDRYQPRSLDEWRSYVRAVVTRYGDRVQHWEVGNEMDFHPPYRLASFSGTTRDYVDLLRVVSEEVRARSSSGKVLTTGLSLIEGPTDPEMTAEMMRLGAADHFDIYAFHSYAAREKISSAIQTARSAKPAVPLWQTERQIMGGERDEHQVIHTLFWGLARGWQKYFFHSADYDRHFGRLKPTPYYAVTAEVARHLRVADAYLGPVPGAEGFAESWQLRLSDGRFLQVFAVNNARFSFMIDKLSPGSAVRLTNLYGETLHDAPLPADRVLHLDDYAYLVTPSAISTSGWRRETDNLLQNPGFETHTGDVIMDASSARPAAWTFSPRDVPAQALSFVPGRTGSFAVRLDGRPTSQGAWVQQRHLLPAGRWVFTVHVRLPKGVTAPLRLILHDESSGTRWPSARDARHVTGTGDWQPVSSETLVSGDGAWVRAMIGIDSTAHAVDIDDADLRAAP